MGRGLQKEIGVVSVVGAALNETISIYSYILTKIYLFFQLNHKPF